jgi:ABC-2 type transport system ATP-binding protein
MTANQVQGPVIHVKGLKKSYKKLEALRGVDFDEARRSIFALLGSNGAGKTTAVKILSTLLKADAGTANVNLVLVARLRHLKDPGTIADDLLERFSLTDAAARKVSTYSGACAAASTSRWASSGIRRSSSSTSRRLGSTPSAHRSCGRP